MACAVALQLGQADCPHRPVCLPSPLSPAGLASALAGITPPYQHYEPAAGRLVADWRWAVGATPFGPYSNFSGVSETMQVRQRRRCVRVHQACVCACALGKAVAAPSRAQPAPLPHSHAAAAAAARIHVRAGRQNVARRNALLAHVSAALRQLQHQLDALDAFVAHHFAGPWEAAGMKDGHRHWLDTVARCARARGGAAAAAACWERRRRRQQPLAACLRQLASDCRSARATRHASTCCVDARLSCAHFTSWRATTNTPQHAPRLQLHARARRGVPAGGGAGQHLHHH